MKPKRIRARVKLTQPTLASTSWQQLTDELARKERSTPCSWQVAKVEQLSADRHYTDTAALRKAGRRGWQLAKVQGDEQTPDVRELRRQRQRARETAHAISQHDQQGTYLVVLAHQGPAWAAAHVLGVDSTWTQGKAQR
jgi:hypothetical protein